MGDQNPWVVENIEAFHFYCCPECDFQSKNGEYFKRHAIESHKKSKVFFIRSKSENIAKNDPLEVEAESEYQEENEEGLKEINASDTRVREESISESEGEEFVEVSENKAKKPNNGLNLESIDDFFEDNLKTIDEQEAGGNVEELETFDDTFQTCILFSFHEQF